MKYHILSFTKTFPVAKIVTLAIAVVLLTSDFGVAQRVSPTRIGRNSTKMKQTLETLTEPIQPSICEVKDGNVSVALGTIVSSDGLVVSKLTEVESAEELRITLSNDEEYPAIVIGEMESYDLALLKIDAVNLTPIELPEAEVDVDAGSFVLSPDENGQMISMGIASVDPRRIDMRQPRPDKRGFLGVQCRPVNEGLRVGRVTSRSGAQKAGIKPNDVLIELDGKKLPSVEDLITLLQDTSPDDEVSLLIMREEKSMDVTVRLGKAPTTSSRDRWGGGPFSNRRFGFPTVIVHDCVIKPVECGGPLVNSDGKVVGINIARALRISTYAVPIDRVTKFVEANKDK